MVTCIKASQLQVRSVNHDFLSVKHNSPHSCSDLDPRNVCQNLDTVKWLKLHKNCGIYDMTHSTLSNRLILVSWWEARACQDLSAHLIDSGQSDSEILPPGDLMGMIAKTFKPHLSRCCANSWCFSRWEAAFSWAGLISWWLIVICVDICRLSLLIPEINQFLSWGIEEHSRHV